MIKKSKRALSLLCCIGLLAGLLAPAASAASAEKPDVMLVYKTHVDVGFVDFAEKMIDKFRTSYIDSVLADFAANSDLPVEQQFKWTVPGWPMKKALEDWSGQTAARKQSIADAIQSGRLGVHAFPYSFEDESVDLEDVVRGMVFSSDIARTYGVDLPRAAKMTDVPSHSWATATILKNAGVEFLHLGCNDASTQPDLPLLFWWEGPDGSRVLTMYSYGYGSGIYPSEKWKTEFGSYIGTFLGITVLNEAAAPATQADVNANIAALEQAGLTYQVGTLEDFADILLENENLDKIPVVRGDMPDTWIHGIMSAPTESKMSRNLRPQVYGLESLGTLLSLWGVDADNATEKIGRANEDILRFGEHTWGFNEHIEDYGSTFTTNKAKGSYDVIQASWDEKTGLVHQADETIMPALEQNMDLLAQSVSGDGDRVVVYNALPWARDGLVTVPISGTAPASLKNAKTGEIIPVEANGDAITFMAQGVPSMGYTTYTFSDKTPVAAALSASANVLENQFYKVTVSPETGSITSIIDKESKRELVAKGAEYGFSQYFNERFSAKEITAYNDAYNTQQGGWAWDDMSKTAIRENEPYKSYPYTKDIPGNFAITYEKSDVSASAVMTVGAAHPEPDVNGVAGNTYEGMSLKVTLYADQPYIDVSWSMDGKAADPWPMADWLSFPFAVENPQYHLYRLGGVMDPAKDIVTNSNVNVLALDGGLTVTDESGNGVGLCSQDAPLVSIGKPGMWKFDKGQGAFSRAATEPTVFLNLFNNQWDTNYPTWNGGDWSSTVRLWSVNGENTEQDLVTPSRETRLPMSAAYAGSSDGTLPQSKSGVQLSAKGVNVTAFGSNIDGSGTILRLWEQAGRAVDCTVTLPSELQATSVQPVDLRGQTIGRPIPVRNNRFTVHIGKNAPYSVVIDYEREEEDVVINPVEGLHIVNDEALPGTVTVTWDTGKEFDGNVDVAATSVNGRSVSAKAAYGDGSMVLNLESGKQYNVSATVISKSGKRSEAVTINVDVAGSPVISVAEASSGSQFENNGPIQSVDGSGMSGMNPFTATHDNEAGGTTMWYMDGGSHSTNGWVTYDFGSVRSLDQLHIWNYNQWATRVDADEGAQSKAEILRRGLRNVRIEYSVNGQNWTPLAAPENIEYVTAADDPVGTAPSTDFPFQLAKGTGEAKLKATNLNTADHQPVDFGGINARYVRLTAQSSWGIQSGSKYWGLSEVMFTEKLNTSGIKSVTVDAAETIAGTEPVLPTYATVTYADDSTARSAVTWERVDPADYTQPGTFTAKGTIFGYKTDITCDVTVKAGIGAGDKVSNAVVAFGENGTATLTWTDPAAAFERILVEWNAGAGKQHKYVEKGEETIVISDLAAETTVKFSIYTVDIAGNTSDPVTLYGKHSGSGVLGVSAATASSEWGGGVNAGNTINKSGMTGTNPLTATHDNNGDGETMWHTSQLVDGKAWIQFDLGAAKELNQMYIWNMNQSGNTNRGLKDVKIEYSPDGEAWMELKADELAFVGGTPTADYPFQLTQATGQNGMTATNLNTADHAPISFNNVLARYVKVTAANSWGSGYWGLSEVMFTGKEPARTVVSAQPAAVNTQVGICPKLPERVDVTYRDKSSGSMFVTWEAFDAEEYAKPGTFKVAGTVAGTEIPAECTVTVKPLPTDWTALNSAIARAVNKPEAAYTAASWTVLKTAYAGALAVAGDAAQETVDIACAALLAAMEHLVLLHTPADFTALYTAANTLAEANKDNLYSDKDQAADGQYAKTAHEELSAALQESAALKDVLADVTAETVSDYQVEWLSRAFPQIEAAKEAFEASKVSVTPPTMHTITATAGENGAVSPNGSVKVANGKSQTFTVAADEGYGIEDVKVDGKSVGALSEYIFKSVTADHSITASFKTISPSHSMISHAAVAATCTAAGSIAYWECSDCNKYFSDAAGNREITLASTAIPALGHDYGPWSVTKPATCTAAGEETHTCKNDPTHKETREIEMLEHSFGTGWKTDATGHWHVCTLCHTEKTEFAAHTPDREEATKTEAVTCTVCGYIITPATGHINHTPGDEWVFDEVNHWHKCTGCEEKMDLAEHIWVLGDETETEQHYNCLCGAAKTESVAPPETVSVTGVEMVYSSADFYVGSTKELVASVKPEDATNKDVTWTTSDPEVVTVDENGKIKAVGEGRATITVTTVDGGFTADCVITVITYVAPPSGGGSSNNSSKTEKNKDGSTTKTVTNKKTGDVTATTTYPDGTKVIAATPKDGETTIEVTVPKNKETVIVIIPTAAEPKPGEVAVIVKEDGSREIIKTSVATKDGMKVLLSESCKLEIMDNSRTFTDVAEDNWAAAAVQFAASRELFGGTGKDTFAPLTDMSRAMLVTVLARLDGVDTGGGDTWYAKAADWAKSEGITDGTGLDASITRESLAVMLYRYAGSPEADESWRVKDATPYGEYMDVDSVSAWASEAMTWAVDTGIISGKSGNLLDPQGTAARAEVAAVLERLIGKMA